MADYVVLAAGNIGAGKSELVQFIEKNKDRFNPLLKEGWEVGTVNEHFDPDCLELFYENIKRENPEKYVPAIFERDCLIARQVRHMKVKRKNGIFVFDRGMIEGAETFCKNSFEEGYLTHEDWEDYTRDLKRGLDNLGRREPNSWLESLVVYLRVEDSKILQERQVRRGTKGENIPLEYLQRINEKYEALMGNISQVYARYGVRAPKLITIDASIDFREDTKYHSRILEKIVAGVRNGINP